MLINKEHFYELQNCSDKDRDSSLCLWILGFIFLSVIKDECLSFYISGPDPICNEVFELTNEVTILTSPNYPSEYFSSLNCQWIAVAPGGYQILGKVRNFTTEGSFDVVVTGTGTDPNNRTSVFDTASGNVPPVSQLFDTNEIWLAFASDASVQAPGFQYELIAVKSEEGKEAF